MFKPLNIVYTIHLICRKSHKTLDHGTMQHLLGGLPLTPQRNIMHYCQTDLCALVRRGDCKCAAA